MNKKLIVILLLFAAILGAAGYYTYNRYMIVDNKIVYRSFEKDTVEIITADGKRFEFIVEIPRTAKEKAQGLMYRKEIGENEGMLFPFDLPQTVSFWMKNVLVNLDFLFLDTSGKIIAVRENAFALDESIISTGDIKVAAVLELKAWTLKKNKIEIGDFVSHEMFKTPDYYAPEELREVTE